jgi:3-hydroxybutyryl-CoA dehydratase
MVREAEADEITTPVDLSFDEIDVGMGRSFCHTVTERDHEQFAVLSGDFSPLHTDEDYASRTPYGRRIVYGMYLGALMSRLIGMYLPGRRSLCLAQSLDFIQPVYIGDEVEVSGEVQRKQDTTRTLILRTAIHAGPERIQVVRGKAHVLVLD